MTNTATIKRIMAWKWEFGETIDTPLIFLPVLLQGTSNHEHVEQTVRTALRSWLGLDLNLQQQCSSAYCTEF